MLSVTSPKEGTITKHNIEKTESQTNNMKLVARVYARMSVGKMSILVSIHQKANNDYHFKWLHTASIEQAVLLLVVTI